MSGLRLTTSRSGVSAESRQSAAFYLKSNKAELCRHAATREVMDRQNDNR